LSTRPRICGRIRDCHGSVLSSYEHIDPAAVGNTRHVLVSDLAGRSNMVKLYPELESVRLTDYKVRIIDSRSGTAATTRVLIESTDGIWEWGTIGVNESIVEASLEALVDSLEYALARRRIASRE